VHCSQARSSLGAGSLLGRLHRPLDPRSARDAHQPRALVRLPPSRSRTVGVRGRRGRSPGAAGQSPTQLLLPWRLQGEADGSAEEAVTLVERRGRHASRPRKQARAGLGPHGSRLLRGGRTIGAVTHSPTGLFDHVARSSTQRPGQPDRFVRAKAAKTVNMESVPLQREARVAGVKWQAAMGALRRSDRRRNGSPAASAHRALHERAFPSKGHRNPAHVGQRCSTREREAGVAEGFVGLVHE